MIIFLRFILIWVVRLSHSFLNLMPYLTILHIHHTLGHHSIPIFPHFPNFPYFPYFPHSTRPRPQHCQGSYSSCVRLFSSRTWSQTTFCKWTQKWSHFLSLYNLHQGDSQSGSHQAFPPRQPNSTIFHDLLWPPLFHWIRVPALFRIWFFLMTSLVDNLPALRISFGTLWMPHIGRGSHLMSEALIFRRNRRNLVFSNVRVQSEVDFVKLFTPTVQNLTVDNTYIAIFNIHSVQVLKIYRT